MLEQSDTITAASTPSSEARAPLTETDMLRAHSVDDSAGSELPVVLLDDLSDDDSWAKPKKRTNKRLGYFTVALALALFGIGTFIAGAKVAGGSSSSSGGGAGRTGVFGGFGGATGLPGGLGGAGGLAGGTGRRNSRTASSSSTATAAGSSVLNDLINGSTATATGPAIQGKVTAIDATSITVTKADGTTAVITIDNNSTFARRTAITFNAIKVGDEVAADGIADTVGNVAATAVTVGDLPAADTTSSEPTPETGSDLGGLLGG